MKRLFLFSILIAGSVSIANARDVNLQSFSEHLMKDVDTVMKDNTYKYKKQLEKGPGRFPASVEQIMEDKDLHELQEDSLEK